ncbi:MAG: serine/threonine protein kinase [Polyangiaceae bacterium]|nr:serine/threonine protein kinase [Polyangiaceae bacterium]
MTAVCPSEEVLASFFARRMTPDEQDDLEAHLDSCASCRRAVAALAVAFSTRAEAEETAPPTEPHETSPLELAAGAQVGRYVVLRRLGRGGMGVVYAALDPSLDRTVAVKVLGAHVESAAARARLLDEAKLMAKLAHPNVVSVFDVGFFGEHPIVAMERIEGETLRTQLGKPGGAGSRKKTLEVLFAAGRGLAAIHAAGLVHRDFKPENVILGDDGRVRVVDLGLATTESGDDGRRIAGTPTYMAPEQQRGEAVDARADQYAFAVTAWEALFDSRPFGKGELAKKIAGVSTGDVKRTDRGLAKTLARALEPDPRARFGSMDELLRALTPAPRRFGIGAIASVLAVVGIGAFAMSTSGRMQNDTCSAVGAEIGGTWGVAQRPRVRAAFDASGAGFAGGTADSVLGTLDKYAGAWKVARERACQLGRKPDGAAPAQAALRNQCLDDRRRELAALVSVFSEPSDELPLRAPRAVADLAPVEACDDDEALLKRVPPAPPEDREAVEGVRDVIRHGSALWSAGRFVEAEDVFEGIRGTVDALGYEPLRAEWLLARGSLSQSMVGASATEELLREATFAAEASRHDVVAAQAWGRYARWLAWQGQRFDRAELAIERADAAILRIGGDERLRFGLVRVRAFLKMGYGDLDAALEMLRALEKDQRARLGDSHPDLVDTYREHARAALLRGEYAELYTAAEAGVRAAERSMGPDHPDTAELRHMLGAAALRTGKMEMARAQLERARAAFEAAYGPEHTKVDFTLAELARLASLDGANDDDAVMLAERGMAINVDTFGPNALPVVFALVPLAEVQLRAGRIEDGLRSAERAAGFWSTVMPPDHYLTAEADALVGWGRALGGDYGGGAEAATRAHAYYEKHGGPPERRAQAAVVLAAALVAGGDQEGGRVLGAEALKALEPLGPAFQRDRDQMRAVLESAVAR